MIGRFTVGNNPTGVACDGVNVWVANNADDTVSKLSLDGTVLGTYAVGKGPQAILLANGGVVVANEKGNSLTRLSSSGAVLGTYAVGKRPVALALEGTNLWVANNKSNNVMKLSAAGAILATYAVGDGPAGIAFDGTSIWVTNFFSRSVMKLNPSGATAHCPTQAGAPPPRHFSAQQFDAAFQRELTARVALPPRLLRTVMFRGLADRLKSPLYWPPPLLLSVPISCPLEVLKTCSVASERVLVASTRKLRLPDSYSAREIVTRSVVGAAGLIVSVAARVTPPRVALIVAPVVEVTVVVPTLKVAEDAPAGTVTVAGTEARALLLASLTVVAAVAFALKVTRP